MAGGWLGLPMGVTYNTTKPELAHFVTGPTNPIPYVCRNVSRREVIVLSSVGSRESERPTGPTQRALSCTLGRTVGVGSPTCLKSLTTTRCPVRSPVLLVAGTDRRALNGTWGHWVWCAGNISFENPDQPGFPKGGWQGARNWQG